jgi:uncharacterized protein (TIGR03435 family)
MLRARLADRFGLVTHSERRDMPLFALVMSDGDNRPGPFLHQTPVGGPCDYDELQSKEKNRPRPSSGYAMFTMYCAPMSNFVLLVTNQVDRPVVDRTGLTGDWSGFLYFAPDPGRSPLAGRADPNLAALPTALEEQFGLKLEPTHGPVDVIVIDSVHAPTSN